MSDLSLVLVATVVVGASGIPALLVPNRPRSGQWLTAALLVTGSCLGLIASGHALLAPQTQGFAGSPALPMGKLVLGLDGLTTVFLVPVFLIPALGTIYGLGYWPAPQHPQNSRRLGLFYGVLAAGMALVLLARDAVLFLVAWEAMALAAFFLATAQDDDPAACQAGWVYLVATHLGTLCLMAVFALLHHFTGSWSLTPEVAGGLAPAAASTVFVLALVGFGVKAGIMPVHVWLPGAHANAPSHVSAVMSGVMLKLGVYGILRLTSILPTPPLWWGGLLVGLGAASGVLGIAFAIGQQDLKRLLAYSSIENVGIIVMGIGLAALGRATGQVAWQVLGLGGALLHVWNHSLFKSLLFLNAGAVIHATGTRAIDRLGGLAKRMPLTAGLFVLGAAAIAALPPLNGFASEFLIYQGLLHAAFPTTEASLPLAALGAVALAGIGALAVGAFVRALGTVFLGEARTSDTDHAHDPGLPLLLPMLFLAGCCLAVGLCSWAVAPCLLPAVAVWSGLPACLDYPLAATAPLGQVAMVGATLLALVAGLGWLGWRVLKHHSVARAGTWDCGYARPTPRIQYTGSSFGQTLVDLFGWALWPRRWAPRIQGTIPLPSWFASTVPDTVLDRLVLPVFRLGNRLLPVVRLTQQGRINVYLLYIPAMVLVLWFWILIGE